MRRLENILLKLKTSLLKENKSNQDMLDTYIRYTEGLATEFEIRQANQQLKENLKSLGLGFLILFPFSSFTIPYIVKKSKDLDIDLVPNWYKALSRDDDRLE